MLIEQADFNTILITFITSTSALIAILGGFFISRVISLASEQNNIYIRYKQIEHEIITKELIMNTKKIHLQNLVAEDFITENIEFLMNKKQDPEKLIKNYQSKHKHEDLMRCELERFEAVYKDFKQIRLPSIDPALYPHFNSDSLLNDIKYADKKLWYKILIQKYYERQPEGLNPFEDAEINVHLNKHAHDFLERDKDYENDIYAIEALKKELHYQKRLSNQYKSPKEIFIGMTILIYGALVGIIVPFVFLVFGYTGTEGEGLVGLLLFFFISFLAALIIYLSVSFHRLNTRFVDYFKTR